MNDLILNYRRYLFLIIAIACYSNLFSQSVLSYDVLSPEVGSLLRVQESSVNLYTGRPHISIPLYSMKLKNFTYDIELLYNAEGHKPDMPVGNVGLGWSITGGQISRVANGVWDEAFTFTDYPYKTEIAGWNQESNLNRYYHVSASNPDYGKEPDLDEFIINIGPINTSFYMYQDRNGKIVTKIASQNSPYFEVTDVKIGTLPEIPLAENDMYVWWMDKTYHPKISIHSAPRVITEITVVDSNGVTYVFGSDVNSIDLSLTYMQDPNYGNYYNQYGEFTGEEGYGPAIDEFHSYFHAVPSTWHIKKITLPNARDVLTFQYLKGNVNIVTRIDLHDILTATNTLNSVYSSTVNSITIPFDADPHYWLLKDKKFDIIYPSSLKRIDAGNGDFVEFTSSTRKNGLNLYSHYLDQAYILHDNYSRLLTKIDDKCYSYRLDKIKTCSGKTIAFSYMDQPDRRLRLNSLTVNEKEKYEFQYNPQNLPLYGKTQTDNWGYYNGKNYRPHIGNGSGFKTLYAFRQPDSTCVKAEILEKITYPTGGTVQFQYELHTYSKVATQYPFGIKTESGIAGGVRIRKIIYSDPQYPAKERVKEYLYVNEDGSSSGILSVVPQYVVSGEGRVDFDGNGIHIHGSYDYRTAGDTQINWVDQFHIGYSRVTELLSDGSKTVYSFINHDQVKDEPSAGDIPLGMTDMLCHKYTSRKLDRGLLKSIQYYGATNNPLKQEEFQYHSDLSDYLKTINTFVFKLIGQPRRVSANKIYTYFPYLKKKETTLYVNGDSINETEEYEYNRYRLLTRTKKYTNSPNENSTLETGTKYLSDLMEEYHRDVSSADIPTFSPLKAYAAMKKKRLWGYPVETAVKRNGKVTTSEVTTYKLHDNSVVLDKLYKLKSDVPLDNYSSFKLTSPTQCSIDQRCAVEMEYLDHDSYCNPTELVDKSGIHTVYIWGYNGQYPVAKVAGVMPGGANDIFYENFETDNQGYSSFGYHSDKSHVGSYTVSMETNPGKEYVIDYWVFKDEKWNYVKCDFLNGSATIREGINPVDDIRVYPIDAFVTTYSHYPLIGLRSMTNERGISESYEYDSFGRLKTIKDTNQEAIKSFYYNYYNQ